MKLSAAFLALSFPIVASQEFGDLPPNLDTADSQPSWTAFVAAVFPTWCIDENENRLTDIETCADGTPNGRWDPLYLTKWHGGSDPALGGYPTDVDTRYPFYYASAFMGQACAGGNAHCSFDFDGTTHGCQECGKIVTDNDDGPNGPGHVPPHIGLAALTRAYYDGGFGDVSSWFDYSQNGCRVLPNTLLPMIRKYFPRNEDGSNSYPGPFTVDGGPGGPGSVSYPYPLEFVNLVGDSCTAGAECYEQHSEGTADDFPDYLQPGHGSPHYCSKEAKGAGVNNDWCPYIFFGPNRGQYRHPHIAFAAVETWLANKVMPDKCGPTWDDNDGKTYPYTPDNSIAFPKMSSVEGHESDPKQPTITAEGGFIWPGDEGCKRKPALGSFVMSKYLTPTTIGVGIPELSLCTDDHDDHGADEHDHAEPEVESPPAAAPEDAAPVAAPEESGEAPSSRSLRQTTDNVHQFTLYFGGLVLAAGGYFLAN